MIESPLQEAMDAVTEGQSIDWPRLRIMQDLSIVLDGVRYTNEALEREAAADAYLEQFVSG